MQSDFLPYSQIWTTWFSPPSSAVQYPWSFETSVRRWNFSNVSSIKGFIHSGFGGFQLEFVSISRVIIKSHDLLWIRGLLLVEYLFKKKSFKVEILWEGHKIWKNIPPVLTKQLFLLCNVKKSGRFLQIFVTF